MTDPAWIEAVCARHAVLVDASFLRPLTEVEQGELARLRSLLEAWEAYDLGGTETLLRLRLALQGLDV